MIASDSSRGLAGGPASWTVLLLAGGASRRLGGGSKALLPVGDRPAIVRMIDLANSAGCRRTVAVLGAHRKEIGRAVSGHPVELVLNPEWERGRTGTVQVGLEAIGRGEPVLLWPVDHPFVHARTIRTLRDEAGTDALATWTIPTYDGRGGHPVWIAPPALDDVMSLRPDEPLHNLLPKLGPQVRRIPVPDPGVVERVDTLESSRRHGSAWAARGGDHDGP